MSKIKHIFLLALAGVFDALKLMCVLLVFLAPALVGALVGAQYGSVAGWVAGSATAISYLFPAIPAAIGLFGVILGFAVTFIGWCFFVTFLLMTSPIEYVEAGRKRFLTLAVSAIVSLVPFVGALIPTFTFYVWRITGSMRAHDKEKHAKWKKDSNVWRAEQQSAQTSRMQQIQAARSAQALQAASDNDVIPEEMRQAA
ncbi:MAG: hypothetical protein Q7S95_01645 [bacterium]|nr:hypothetical protein [bacterium]